MKKFFILLTSTFFSFFLLAQDNIYTISHIAPTKLNLIQANPSTGSLTSAATVITTNVGASAAMGLNSYGWMYYILYGSAAASNGSGSFTVNSIKSDGTGAQTNVLTADVNGAATSNATFKWMGINKTGDAYILSVDGSTLYLGKFSTTATGTVSGSYQPLGTLTTSDGGGITSGDIVFDASGNLYFVAYNVTGATPTTKIYILPASVLATATAASTLTLQYKWLLKNPDGNNFGNTITGAAFSSSGSIWISQDDGNLYYIDATTVNSQGTGTVVTKSVGSIGVNNFIGDLASNIYPLSTALPVKFGAIDAKIIGGNLLVNWTTETETGNDHFEIEASNDGLHFTKLGTIKSKAIDGNSAVALNYEFSTNGAAAGLLSILLVVFVSLGFGGARRIRLFALGVGLVGATLFFNSCRKHDALGDDSRNKIFVLIVQVDKDGAKKASRIVQATWE